MRMLDVNVLIYAHREDSPEHERYADYLQRLVTAPEPYAVSELVLSAFLRLVTNRKIFKPPTPMAVALRFCSRLTERPQAVPIRPGRRHWQLFVELIEAADVEGPLTADAYLAALAMEHGCELISADSDFARFPGLRWSHPMAPGRDHHPQV